MEVNEIISYLVDNKTAINKLKPINGSGVYAIFHRNIKEIIEDETNEYGIIYIGQSTNLAQREFDTHFKSGESGFSTLRRSIGAIFKKEFDLRAIPRSSGSSDTNWRNYKFTPDGEERITKWMKENLLVAVYKTIDFDKVESELITAATPLLNLTGWGNPYAQDVKKKRKICAEEAKSRMRN